MAYNTGFPINYQQTYMPQQTYVPQMQVPQVPPQTQPQSNGIIWVQGEAGAKSYMVAPNNTVQLWDSENQVIYLKSADASGMPTMKVLDYTIRQAENQQSGNSLMQQSDYVTRDEFSAFENKIRQMIKGAEEDGKSDF